MIKSEVLCELLRAALSEKRPLVYRDDSAEKVDSFVSQADVYSNDYKDLTQAVFVVITVHVHYCTLLYSNDYKDLTQAVFVVITVHVRLLTVHVRLLTVHVRLSACPPNRYCTRPPKCLLLITFYLNKGSIFNKKNCKLVHLISDKLNINLNIDRKSEFVLI